MDASQSENRAQRQYKKRKQRQQEKKLLKKQDLDTVDTPSAPVKQETPSSNGVEIEYVQVNPLADMDESDPNYAEFAEIFRRYNLAAEGKSLREDTLEQTQGESEEVAEAAAEAEPEDTEPIDNVPKKLSKRQKRLANRYDIADLKAIAKRADLVEIHDTTAKDPELLVDLKAQRNTVPVPRHWSQKRKYLQGKRGIEKIPYQLPEFIRNTGIAELRQAALDRAEAQKLKTKQRERLRPKMGQLDVDYAVLRDAFFRYQTKPNLTRHGELYYEGREFEPKTRDFVAGVLSENLRKALGMTENSPPPWLFQMQPHGPPPSYPGLRIPGVNAPIPEGAKYGFHTGGWGKPPIGIDGRPIWGWADARVTEEFTSGGPNDFEPGYTFGSLLYADDYEDEYDEDAGDMDGENENGMNVDEEDAPGADAHATNMADRNLDLDAGDLNLRKDAGPRELFQVLEQQSTSVGNAAMGSSNVYRMPSRSNQGSQKKTIPFLGSRGAGELEITLTPEDLELSEEQLRKKYENAYRDFENQQLAPRSTQLSDADRDEMMRRSMVPSSKDKPKDKKNKDYVKF